MLIVAPVIIVYIYIYCVCFQVQDLISREVQSALEQSDKMMKALMERIQEVDNEPRFDTRIRNLEVSAGRSAYTVRSIS